MKDRWLLLRNLNSRILAVHAALIRTHRSPEKGEILYFSGSEYSQTNHDQGNFNHTGLFDCTTSTVQLISSPPTDLFCCGHSLLADGRLLVAGGSETYDRPIGEPHGLHWYGERNAYLFDINTKSWLRLRPMAHGRWYPTLLTLPDGRGLALSGHPARGSGRHNNNTPEIFSPRGRLGNWRLLPAPQEDYELSSEPAGPGGGRTIEYPRLHVLPNGKVVCPSPLGFRIRPDVPDQMQVIDPATGRRAFVGLVPGDPDYSYIHTTSVLLPLLPEDEYRVRVLMCGAIQPVISDLTRLIQAMASSAFTWSDLRRNNLVDWRDTSPRPIEIRRDRLTANAVILPTGEVFVCGGVTTFIGKNPKGEDEEKFLDIKAVKEAELFSPKSRNELQSDDWRWTKAAKAEVARNYHSVALLMQDGRVWTAGSSKDHAQGKNELRIEIYEPWYFKEPRPQITQSPRTVHYGREFIVDVNNAESLERVAILRVGSVTHAFNSDQRYVGLRFSRSGNRRLRVKAPPNANIAPPGYYLLFAINRKGVPSEGRFVHVWQPWFRIGDAGLFAPEQPVTALWSNRDHLDLFAVGKNGVVLSTYWEGEKGWQPWFILSPPETAVPGQAVTALWSNPNHLDLFVTRHDGMVISTFWEGGLGWRPWFGISPPGTTGPGQPVTALWSNTDHLDLFVVRQDGTVLSTFWEARTSWRSWFAISPPRTAAPGQRILALWSNRNHLDLFVSAKDGSVVSTFWEGGRGWQPWFAISPPRTVTPGNSISGSWSTANHLDLFVTRDDGTVLSSFWEFAGGWRPWFSIGPDVALPKCAPSILWSNPNHLDVFVTGKDGALWSGFWEGPMGWRSWFAISPPPETSVTSRSVAALWSNPNHLDLFVTAKDGGVWSIWWEGFQGGW